MTATLNEPRVGARPATRHYVTTNDDLRLAVAVLAASPVVGVDIETYSTDPSDPDGALFPPRNRIRLVQLASWEHSFAVDLHYVTDLEPLRRLFEDPSICKVGHNLKFENMNFLHHWDTFLENSFDTMIASRLFQFFVKRDRDTGFFPKGYDPEDKRHNLAATTLRYLGRELSKEMQTSDWSAPELSEAQIDYAFKDAEVVLELHDVLSEKLRAEGMWEAARIENAAVPAIAEMELSGWHFDRSIVEDIARELDRRIARLGGFLSQKFPAPQRGLWHDPGINLNSPDQLKRAFQARYGIQLPATEKSILLEWRDPDPRMLTGRVRPMLDDLRETVDALVDYSSLQNLRGTCDELLAEIDPTTGRVHPDIIQIGQDQHRTAVRKPNTQKIPRPGTWGPKSDYDNFRYEHSLRSAFTASPGNTLAVCDYSGNQLRVIARLSRDPVMIKAFLDGKDLHAVTAANVLGKALEDVTSNERQNAKTWNFAFSFGVGPKAYARQRLEATRMLASLAQCEEERNAFFSVYKALRPWHERLRRFVKANGYIETPIGRKIFFYPGGDYFNEPVNFPVCATEVDGARLALARLFRVLRKRRLRAKLTCFVYDEIVIDVAESEAEEVSLLQQEVMRDSMQRMLEDVPAAVEGKIGRHWAAAK